MKTRNSYEEFINTIADITGQSKPEGVTNEEKGKDAYFEAITTTYFPKIIDPLADEVTKKGDYHHYSSLEVPAYSESAVHPSSNGLGWG